MTDGFKKLINIVLIGQSELLLKLSATNLEVREVTQRIEQVVLKPLNSDLENYLNFKFARIGKRLSDVIDASGIKAIQNRLTIPRKNSEPLSLLYPLAINNLLTAAMNDAAKIYNPIVDADTVKTVNLKNP